MQYKKGIKPILIILCMFVLLSAAGCRRSDEGGQSHGMFFQEDSVTLEKYETYTLELQGAEGKQIEWKSNDEEIATVEDGVICGWKKGNTQILAYVDGVEVSCNVMVSDNQYVPVIKLGDRDELTMDIGGAYGLKPVIHYNGKTYTDAQFTYSSTTAAVTVTENGVITAAEAGEALMCVQAQWRKNVVEASVAVHVIDASTSIEVSGKEFDIYLNGRSKEFPSSTDIGVSIFDKDEPVEAKDASVKYTELIMEGDLAGAAFIENGVAHAAEIGTIHFIAEYTSADGTVVRSTSFAVNVHQSPYDKYMTPIKSVDYEFFIEPISPVNTVTWNEAMGAFHLANTITTASDDRGFLFSKDYINNILRYTNARSIAFEVKADGIRSGINESGEVIYQGFYPEWFDATEYLRIDNTGEWTKIEIFFDDIPRDKEGNIKAILLLSTAEGMYIRNIRPMTEGSFLTMDVEFTTLGGNWNQEVELAFCPYSYKGSINDCKNRVAINAETKTTVKVRLDEFLEGGKLPGFGVIVFGGPEWDDKLSDGYTPDRHTLTISNLRVTGEKSYSLDLSTASCATGKNGTGFTDANNSGVPMVMGGAIVISNGFRYDAHKITLDSEEGRNRTYLCMDMLLTTLGESTEPVEIRFYPYNFDGSVHEEYTDKIVITAGTSASIKLNQKNYLVDGELPGIGFAIFGGPEWNTKLEDGYTPDRHSVTVSNVYLEGAEEKTIDLSNAAVVTGFADSNGGGAATVEDGAVVVNNGFRYDGHMITFGDGEGSGATDSNTYLYMDLLIDTLGGNWTDDIEIGFFSSDFEGDINNWKEKVTVKAGATSTVKLKLDSYLVDGEFTGIGFAIFGGPAWDAKLPDGYTPDRHTVTISNVHIEGDQEKVIDLNNATVSSGTNGTGYTNANGSGVATIADGVIVITNGYRFDGHKITFGNEDAPERTYICMDMLLTTLGGAAEPVEVRFYPNGFDGNVHEEYTDKLLVTAGTTANIRLPLDNYLADGKVSGIGFAIFGGPEWNTQLADGTYDRHAITISNVRLEGGLEQVIDLSNATVTTGFANSNSGGLAAVADGSIVVTGGYRYDGHMITLGVEEEPEPTEPEITEPEATEPPVEELDAYLCMDLDISTLGNSKDPIEVRLYNYSYAASVADGYTDQITVTPGTTANIKVDADKYLVEGQLPGFGIAIFGGPEWNTYLEDGTTPDRHTFVISNVRLEGTTTATYDLYESTVTTGTSGTNYTWANGAGQKSLVDGNIVISGGYRYDGHKITLVEESGTYLCMDMNITTLGGETGPIDFGFYPYNFEGDINNHPFRMGITAGKDVTVRLKVDDYLVNGELPGIGFAIFGGPAWDAKLPDGYTPDRHTITISNVRLEGEQTAVYDLSKSAWASGTNGTGYTNANGSGVAAIGETIVITNGFRYDGHKISLVAVEEETPVETFICLDLLIDTLGGNWTDDIEIGFFSSDFEGDINNWKEKVTVKAGTTSTVKLKLDSYLVDGEFTGIGFAIFGGPAWDAKLPDGYTPDRHTVTISNVHLEGDREKVIDLNNATVSSGTNGTGYTNANGSGAASIVDGSIVITNGFRYDGHKLAFGVQGRRCITQQPVWLPPEPPLKKES